MKHGEEAREMLPGEKLRAAAATARPQVFRELYNQILAQALSNRNMTPGELQLGTNEKFNRFIRNTAGSGKSVLEIGCGFGTTALHVARGQRQLIGVDTAPVAVEVANGFAAKFPNLSFEVMGATRLEFPDSQFDMAYSIDLIEHLHPDDVLPHLGEVFRVLKAKGLYVVKTPSVLTGPHDASHPDDPGRLHLREYSYGTLMPLLKQAGFRRLSAPSFSMRLASRLPGPSQLPARCNLLPEALACLAPPHSKARARLARSLGVKQVMVVARKPQRG